MKINFALNSSSIVVIINFGYKEYDILKNKFVYKPLKYYTGIKVKKHEWNAKLKRPYDQVKAFEIAQIERKITDIFNYLKIGQEITFETFKAELDNKLKGKRSETVKKIRIVDFIEQEIETSSTLKKSSKVAYAVFKRKLERFEQTIGKKLFTNNLDESLYLQFMEQVKQDRNRINGLWGVQKVFRATLHEISRKYKLEVFNPSKDLAQKDKVQQQTEVDSVYLDFQQIAKIIDYTPQTENLKNTKLILLILLFTGCRESDAYKIKPVHFYDKNGEQFYYVHYFSEKTDIEVLVPILKPLAKAFEQNNGNPPTHISQQKFNVFVKELAGECGLNEDVTITYTNSFGKKRLETKPLHAFISSHIGRRSFVTNLINYIPITTLSKITGHTLKNKSVIFGYNKISLLDNAVLFRKQLRRAVEENPDHFIFPLA